MATNEPLSIEMLMFLRIGATSRLVTNDSVRDSLIS
jgi:hypothetical protein